MQKTQTMQFAVETKDGEVQKIGKSAILQPKTNYKENKGTKWFDDTKLLKNK